MQKKNIKQNLLKFNTYRRVIQFFSFMLFSAVIFDLGEFPLLLPVLWAWGLKQNVVGDAFTAIQLTLSGWKGFSISVPWLAVAAFLITGILIGKSLCGWVCPFGFIQDLVSFVKRKKMEISPRTHKSGVYIKYAVLGFALFISLTFSAAKLMKIERSYEAAMGIFAYAPFTAVSPAETLFATIPQMIQDFAKALYEKSFLEALSGISGLPPLFWAQLFILGAFLVFAVYVPRGWCKYFCPHGAIMAILNKFSFLGLRRELVKCTKAGCRKCEEACPMRVPILDLSWEKFSDPECIYCLKCADACENKAIKLKYF